MRAEGSEGSSPSKMELESELSSFSSLPEDTPSPTGVLAVAWVAIGPVVVLSVLVDVFAASGLLNPSPSVSLSKIPYGGRNENDTVKLNIFFVNALSNMIVRQLLLTIDHVIEASKKLDFMTIDTDMKY